VIRRRRVALVAVGAALVLVGGGHAFAGTRVAGGEHEWDAMMAETRERLAGISFEGVVVVEWRDAAGVHRAEVDVRRRGDVVEVAADRVVVAGGEARVLGDGRSWTVLAHDTGAADPRLVPAKYDVITDVGPRIAGRPTTRYTARHGDVVVERVYVDREHGLVLRRETYDHGGSPQRAVWFTRVDVRTPSGPTSSLPIAAGAPRPVDDLADPMRDPESAGDGFRLLGRWEHADGTAQLFYSDGLFGVSVFVQHGRLDWSALPPGDTADVAGHPARRYRLPVGEAWVFERGGLVYTCVGDVPPAELAAVAADVSAPARDRVDRLAELVLAPFRW
jgi:hypothetical protein